MAATDAVAGWASVQAGAYRLRLLATGTEASLVERASCFGVVHVWLLSIASPLQPIMFCVLSLDRLVAVALPLQYYALEAKYSAILVFACFSAALTWTPVLLLHLRTDHSTLISALCIGNAATDTVTFVAVYIVRVVFSCLSVVLYLFVPVFHRRHAVQLCSRGTFAASQARRYLLRQQRLNRTVGICCTFTFVFYVAPVISSVVRQYILRRPSTAFEEYMWLLNSVNALCNVFIYARRHTELRQGMKRLLCCQKPNKRPPYKHSRAMSVDEGYLRKMSMTAQEKRERFANASNPQMSTSAI